MRDVLVVKLTTTTETGKFVNGQSDMVKGDQQPEPDIQESEIEVPECCHWPIPGNAAQPKYVLLHCSHANLKVGFGESWLALIDTKP